ncbi:hypothetical protein O181_079760 [Austropuccinia psidii MF-1]|uniref:Tet-like 2OG-Fe(II) oxygenase domain-containing protein n=1 Tax=Austropuccinia psidii MF-1 TaxID=1389203 RepID=A0A9Q3FFK1_9BASI|nr:hypothetical protein [Austropuccinia psidii MF-1]
MSEAEFNPWDELSQLVYQERNSTYQTSTNGELLRGFMLAIEWNKCSTKNQQFGIYGSIGKIEDAEEEWQKQGENIILVGFILGQSLQYVGDKLLQKIQTCYKSLGVPSFDQVNYEVENPTNHGEFEFASALTLTMNSFKNSPHVEKDALFYALG